MLLQSLDKAQNEAVVGIASNKVRTSPSSGRASRGAHLRFPRGIQAVQQAAFNGAKSAAQANWSQA